MSRSALRATRAGARAGVAALVLLALPACAEGNAASQPGAVESCGRPVSLDAPPEDVLVVGGEAGSLVVAAGGGDLVSTFVRLADEPLGDAEDALLAAEQVDITTISDLSREVVVGHDPDLVVTFGFDGFDAADLDTAGIPTYVIAGYCGGFGAGQSEVVDPIQGVLDDVERLGTLFDTSDEATRAAADLEARVDAVSASAAGTDGPPTAALFANTADAPMGAYGSRSMIHQQMELLGLGNVFEEVDERYFEPSTESLVEAAPQRLIVLHEAADTTEEEARSRVVDRRELASVPAVAEEDLLVLDFYYSGHGTLAVDGLERLAAQL